MIISCPNCTTRLQLDDAKIPGRPFTVRCPKCEYIVNAQPPAANGGGSALAAGGDLPATTRAQREAKTPPAAACDLVSEEATPSAAHAERPADGAELLRALAALLAQGANGGAKPNGAKPRAAWDKRRALVCVSTSQRRDIARDLAADHYDVSVADDTAQAIERMREEKMDVLVLDSEFDLMEQGAAFITREINALRPAERRRMIVVHLSTSARSEDAHAAFLANVNLVVNSGEVHNLPRVLERASRDLNELYKDFNKALGVAGL